MEQTRKSVSNDFREKIREGIRNMKKESVVGYCSIRNMGVIHAIEGSMWEYADESIGDVYAIFMDDDGNGHDFVLEKKEWNQIADRHNRRLQKKLQEEDCCHLFVCFGGTEGEPALDDAERDYLKAVLKPFRKDMRGIEKISDFDETDDGIVEMEAITIVMKNGEEYMLPWFKRGSMYRGMEARTLYSLEELGL